MNRHRVVSAMVLASSLLAGSAAFASPIAPRVFRNAMFGKTHTINFNLRNDGAQSVKVKAGAMELTLEPGKLTPVKLNVGDQVIVAEATPMTAAGTVLTTVGPNLSDSTLSFK